MAQFVLGAIAAAVFGFAEYERSKKWKEAEEREKARKAKLETMTPKERLIAKKLHTQQLNDKLIKLMSVKYQMNPEITESLLRLFERQQAYQKLPLPN